VTFGWKEISYSLETKNGRRSILENVSGIIQPGIAPE
jgi:hypothetical protein